MKKISLTLIAILLALNVNAQVLTSFEDDKLTKTANLIVNAGNRGTAILQAEHKKAFDLIWHNDISAQEVLDKFGANASKLFINSHLTQEFLRSIVPDYESLVPPCAFAINGDGTVTVGECNYPEAE